MTYDDESATLILQETFFLSIVIFAVKYFKDLIKFVVVVSWWVV